MLEGATNTRRKEVRTTYLLGAICAGMLSLFFIVLSLFLFVVKPHYLDKTTQSAHASHVASWYGSKKHLLKSPSDVAFDASGRLYVADSSAREIVIFDRYGQRRDSFGRGVLKTPISVAVARNHSVYVVDSGRKELLIFSKNHVLEKSISFTEKMPLSVSIGADQTSRLKGEEALYVTCETGIIKGNLEGVFREGYFNPGEKDGEFSGLADAKTSVSAVSSADKTPRLFLLDSLNASVEALDSYETSPTIAWTYSGGKLPAGLTADASHVFVTDGQKNCIEVLSAFSGKRVGSLSKSGTKEGDLFQPRGIEIRGKQLYVADSGNGRIAIFNIPGHEAAKIETESPFEIIALVALCIILASLSLAFLIMRSLVKPQRFIVDFSTADMLKNSEVRNTIEQVAETLWYAPALSEWVARGLMHSTLQGRAAKATAQSRAYIENLNLGVDAFDSETLACAHAHNLTVIVSDDALKEVAQKALVSTVTMQELADMVALKQEDNACKEVADSNAAAVQNGEDGVALLRTLVLVASFVVITALVLVLCVPRAQAAGVEHSVVSLSSLPQPEALKNKQPKVSKDTTTNHHARWESDCAGCHASTYSDDSILAYANHSSCQFCHTASGLGGGYSAYAANGGDPLELGEKNSGHQIGLHQDMPASSQSGLHELSCFSCHTIHAQNDSATEKACTACHDKAMATSGEVAAYKEDKKSQQTATDHFVLSKSVNAHDTNTSPENGSAAHTAAGLTCASCHRGTLAKSGSCVACHYGQKEFDGDKNRSAKTSDWPHLSTNDTALLGNWTTQASGASLGKAVPISGGMTLENQTRVLCGRCHTTQDGKTFALSMHTVKHDAVRSGMVEFIQSKATTSTLSTVSPGYIGTGGNSNSAPFASSFEFGPENGSFEGVPCADCHYSDVQTEHQLRSKKGCKACHTTKKSSGQTDWSKVVGDVDAQAFTSCGTGVSACHKDSWHGTQPSKTITAHALSQASSAHYIKTSCAPDGKGLSCHGSASTQSLFRFGSQDLASAHNDYWVAQKQNYSTNTRYTETISNIDTLRGCGLCHDKQTSIVNGVAQRKAAALTGSTFDCSSCHKISTAVYAEDSCLKAPQWKAPSLQAVRKKASEDALTQEAQAYLSKLAQQASGDDVKAAGDQHITSKLKASTTDASLKSVPTEILPTTHPLPPTSPFSIIRAYLAPYPSLMNRPTTSWENV